MKQSDETPGFSGGINIAVKIPKKHYATTVAFYRDVLRLEVEERSMDHPTVSRTHRVQFGPNILWLDCVDNYTRSEVWLELRTDNMQQALHRLQVHGTEPCDELEQIPETMHWIMDPAGTVLLLEEERN